MKLSKEQLAGYEDRGFLVIPDAISPDEVAVLRNHLNEAAKLDVAGINRENNGDVRSVYRVHDPDSPTFLRPFEKLVAMPRLLQPARDLLGDDELYIFQTKCNMKPAFSGGIFQWHQDFGHWQHDGIPRPEMMTNLLMLEAATELGGCLYFIPGSHRRGVLEPKLEELTSTMKMWSLTKDDLTAAMAEHGDPVAITGGAGTMVLFHPNLLHASGHNLSRSSRWAVYTVYNRIANKQVAVESPRPEWAVGLKFDRVDMSDDELLPSRSRAA